MDGLGLNMSGGRQRYQKWYSAGLYQFGWTVSGNCAHPGIMSSYLATFLWPGTCAEGRVHVWKVHAWGKPVIRINPLLVPAPSLPATQNTPPPLTFCSILGTCWVRQNMVQGFLDKGHSMENQRGNPKPQLILHLFLRNWSSYSTELPHQQGIFCKNQEAS